MTNEMRAFRNAPIGSLSENTLLAVSGTSDVNQATNFVTTVPNAAPMTKAMATSTRFPCKRNFLNPDMFLLDSDVGVFPPGWRHRLGHETGHPGGPSAAVT